MNQDITLHLFSKAPFPGRCKNRLAYDLNDPVRAAQIQDELLQMHLNLLATTPFNRHAWIQNLREWLLSGVVLPVAWTLHEVPSDFGLARAIHTALNFSPHDYQIIIGTDTPALFEHWPLISYNARQGIPILGPTHDGGIFVMGLPHIARFDTFSINWETPHVCSQLIKFIEKEFSSFVKLPVEVDIDHARDLHAMDFAKRL